STRWRSRTAVGAEEWLRRGQTKEWVRKQVSCQDFVITIREGRHQFSWHKKQEHSRIFPSDTVVVLTYSVESGQGHWGPLGSCEARQRLFEGQGDPSDGAGRRMRFLGSAVDPSDMCAVIDRPSTSRMSTKDHALASPGIRPK